MGYSSFSYTVRANDRILHVPAADLRFFLGSRVPVGENLQIHTAQRYPKTGWVVRFPVATVTVFLVGITGLLVLAVGFVAVKLKVAREM